MDIEQRDPRMTEVIESSAKMERLATGLGFTEGPVWNGPKGELVFSDIPGSCLYRWEDTHGIRELRRPSNMANGNAYDIDWRLVTCEHATSRLTRTEHDGSVTVLAEAYDGKRLNSPNDVVVRSDGSVYFTDPTYGRQEFFGRPRPVDLAFRAVYRLDPAGRLTMLASDFDEPNGLCFSPDERVLYVNDTVREHIRVFTVQRDGRLGAGEVFAKPVGPGEGSPDGMKTDVEGRVYCSGPGGIHVFDPDGGCIGVIGVPEVVGNFTWGGQDRTDLYICASTSLYRVRMKVPGNVR